MDKSMLVINTPKSCRECELRFDVTDFEYDDNGCDCCEPITWEINRESCPFIYDLNEMLFNKKLEQIHFDITLVKHPHCPLQPIKDEGDIDG